MRRKNLLPMFGAFVFLASCQDEIRIDTPNITSYQTVEVAYMGDSIPLVIHADGQHPLNNIKVTFFQGNERISESIIPIKQGGSYQEKILVPFAKGVEDGTAEIQLMVRNRNFNYSTVLVPIQVTRPKFPYLTLKTAYGDFRMEPVPNEPYKYAVTETFPTSNLNALIEAPAYGQNGNALYFGGGTIVANATDQDSIPFQSSAAPGTPFTVSFDVRSFEGQPFLKPSFGGVEFPVFEGNTAIIEAEFVQNQPIVVDGFVDVASWWVDPTFLEGSIGGGLTFRAADGKYRITADQSLKYIRIEPMIGGQLADFNQVTKTGGVWINGGVGDQSGSAPAERLGIPSMTSNPTGWSPEKNIAMAPLGGGIFQARLVAGQTLFQSNVSGSNVGISFYQRSRSMDHAFPLVLAQTLYGNPGSPSASAGTPRFELKPENATSKGQMITSGSNRSLGSGRTYVFTLDTNVSPASVTISIE